MTIKHPNNYVSLVIHYSYIKLKIKSPHNYTISK